VHLKPTYRITCRQGYILTDANGRIIEDHVGRHYKCEPHDGWRILGFSRAFSSAPLITLDAAASGAPLGSGYVHDLDHGTHRVWGNPDYRRVVKVERIL
jgi:hypothetical protein